MLFQKNVVKKYLGMLPKEQASQAWDQYKSYFLNPSIQQKILNLIKESPTITGRQMSETMSVSQRTIERDLSTLQKKGILKHEGKDNDGVWIIM